MDETTDLYVICGVIDIEPGDAEAFSLVRVNEEGEGRPFPIFIVHTADHKFLGYRNICPHNKLWLNIGDGEFFSGDRALLECGRHGSQFEIDSGLCVSGPCKDARLESVPIVVDGEDVCVTGIRLAEADPFADPFEDGDDTMEIMIHPD